MKLNKNKKGFTLVELIIYMALVSIFFGILTNLFISVLDLKNESVATNAVEADGRFILSRMIYDANQNGSATITSNYSLVGDNLVLDGENLNSSETRIINFVALPLGNVGGRQSVQVKFTVESLTVDNTGGETRDYQITLGSR